MVGYLCNDGGKALRIGLPVPHSHDGYEETLYGVEGRSTWTVDGEPIEIGPGQALCIPRGAKHALMNHGAVDARLLAVISPGILGPASFREMGRCFAQAKGEIGMDHYEVRTWTAWHRFVTLCLLAHALLVVLRAQAVVPVRGAKKGIHRVRWCR